MLLKVGAHVEKRLIESIVTDEQERNEQTAHSTVAVAERVNGLELIVSQG